MDIDPAQATVAEMRTAVEAATTQRECPFCKGTEWMPPEDDRVYVITETKVTGGTLSDVSVVGFGINFVCERCGFLRVHVPTIPTPT